MRRPDATLVTVDHNVPTSDRSGFDTVANFIKETDSRLQVMALEENVEDFGLTYFGLNDKRQGVVHIIGPEQGFTLPGTTVVCGDSHTATHGAFGALAFGIGTSEVEHVLATQTLLQKPSKNMRITVSGPFGAGVTSKDFILHVIGVIGTAGGTGSVIEFAGEAIANLSMEARMSISNMAIEAGARAITVSGPFGAGVTSKDFILHVIGVIGTAGGTGSVIEFAGEAIANLSMEARMSISNMAIEAGARAGIITPDEVTFEYLKGRPMSPKGADWDKAVAYWRSLASDADSEYDTEIVINAVDIEPTVTWGTSPQDVVPISGVVPDPADFDEQRAKAMQRSLDYMGLTPGQKMEEIKIDKAFIGSCTNGRIEDIRAAAAVAKGKKVADHVYAMVVPGSGIVKEQAEAEGLDKILIEAGFDWREPGCSMCLAMNPDKLLPQERCASTSNRNFEGRQGNGGRTHLVSPAMAAAAAITGTLADVRKVGQSTDINTETDSKTYLVAGDVIAPMPKKGKGVAVAGAGGMPKFTVLKGKAASLDMQNIDTDMIIPKQFLKTIKRTGLGAGAFYEMRYNEDGSEKPEFVLNKPAYAGTKILIAGDNFGCGSSREHAPWAINDLGISCIISTSFADIFHGNCLKNGMLPIRLAEAEVRLLMADADAGDELEVDLAAQVVRRPDGSEIKFEVDPFRKNCLLNGLDDIGLTLQKADKIASFEKSRTAAYPWLDGAGFKERQAAMA